MLTKLSRTGWHICLVHPRDTPKDFIDYADENFVVECLIDGNLQEIAAPPNFQQTAWILITGMPKAETPIIHLNDLNDKYESRVIYFNEVVGEAVIELKAFDVEGAVSLLEARVRARSTAGVPSTTVDATGCRMLLVTSRAPLSNVKVASLFDELKQSSTEPDTVSNPPLPLENTVEDGLGGSDLYSSSLWHADLLQQFGFPFCIDPSRQRSSDINVHPSNYSTISSYAAAQMTAAATAAHIFQQQQQDSNPHLASIRRVKHRSAPTKKKETTKNANDSRLAHTTKGNIDVIRPGCSTTPKKTLNPDSITVPPKEEDDSKSHKEAKIEVFSEDEEDYNVDEDEIVAAKENEEKNGWNAEATKTVNDVAGGTASTHQPFAPINYGIEEYVTEYPPLPPAGSGSPLRYSAVVKGLKPVVSNPKTTFTSIRECPNRQMLSSGPLTTQTSQWDQLVVESGGKFSKPAPQCIHWNNPKHRLDFPCRFWHPREQCRYYPNCTNTADECGFAHPFCGDFCHCPKGKRDPQKNHRLPEERYFGGGDRMKFNNNASNNNQQ